MRLDFKRLRAFVTIAETRSITAAAERLNSPQPWLSRQLKELEDGLGAELFERVKGRMGAITPLGEELLPIARRFVDAHVAARTDIETALARHKRKVVLGVEPVSLHISRRNALVNRFLAEKGLEVEIVTRTPAELFEGLAAGTIDLILTCLPASDPATELLEIDSAAFSLAIPRQAAADYPPGRLAGARLLTMPESFHPLHHRWVEEMLAGHAIEWVDCPEASFDALIRYATMLGIATITPDFAGAELATAFELRPLADPPLVVRWALMRRPDRHRPVMNRLWNIAHQFIADEEAAAS